MIPWYHYWREILHNTSKVFKHSVIELMEHYSNMNPSFAKRHDDTAANWFTVEPWKDYLVDGWYIPATAEATRRYYSAKQFLRTFGPPNVATGIIPWSGFSRFFDPLDLSSFFPRPDNKHFDLFSLKRTLERFAHFPIKTKEGEPRLLWWLLMREQATRLHLTAILNKQITMIIKVPYIMRTALKLNMP